MVRTSPQQYWREYTIAALRLDEHSSIEKILSRQRRARRLRLLFTNAVGRSDCWARSDFGFARFSQLATCNSVYSSSETATTPVCQEPGFGHTICIMDASNGGSVPKYACRCLALAR